MSPEELVRCIDFRYITDCITPEKRWRCFEAAAGKAERMAACRREGYPCYTTSAGWLGYDDEKLRVWRRRRSMPASTTSSSRSAATCTTTFAACASRAR